MEAIELLKSIWEGLKFELKPIEVINGLFTLKDLKFSRIGSIVIIDNQEYTITFLDKNTKQIQVNDNNINVLPSNMELKKPYFAHGTAQMQDNEWSNQRFDEQKFPSIYVREVVREQEFTESSGNVLERESGITIYFLDSVNFSEWTTEDHYNFIIPELKYLKNSYIKEIQKDVRTGKLDSYESIIRVNFGIFTDTRGNTQSMFNDRLSAIELGFTLPIYRQFKTDCNI